MIGKSPDDPEMKEKDRPLDVSYFQDYIKYKSTYTKRGTPGNGRENAVQEVTSGLKEYFNVMLGSQLLYKFEREQHSDIIKQFPDTPMSKVGQDQNTTYR